MVSSFGWINSDYNHVLYNNKGDGRFNSNKNYNHAKTFILIVIATRLHNIHKVANFSN